MGWSDVVFCAIDGDRGGLVPSEGRRFVLEGCGVIVMQQRKHTVPVTGSLVRSNESIVCI